jgi:hypothetical protein
MELAGTFACHQIAPLQVVKLVPTCMPGVRRLCTVAWIHGCTVAASRHLPFIKSTFSQILKFIPFFSFFLLFSFIYIFVYPISKDTTTAAPLRAQCNSSFFLVVR